MKGIGGLVLAALALVACGSSEKKDLDLGQKGKAQTGICPETYSPLDLYKPGYNPITDLSALPAGTYRLVASDVYLREEATGGIKAHFYMIQRSGEVLSGTRCTSALSAEALFDVPFPGLLEFTRDAASGTFLRNVYRVQGEKKAATISTVANQQRETGGIEEVLGKWSYWTIYKLTDTEYEINFYASDVASGYRFTKQMSLHYAFAPSAPPVP